MKDIDVRTRLIAYLREMELHRLFIMFHCIVLRQVRSLEGFMEKMFITTKESERLLRLPMFYDLSMDDVDYIAEKIREFEFDGGR